MTMFKRLTLSDRVFDTVNLILLLLVTVVVLYPLYFTIIASFSDPYSVARGEVVFWIKGFTVEPYTNVFRNDDIWIGYKNSIINTVLVVAYNLVITISCAYVLSRREIRGKGIFMTYFIIPMYFGGGMIPSYILIQQLGIMNTRWALIIPAGMSISNMIIARTFFRTNLAEEIFEAAKIDGCSEFGIFFKIALPLSGAIIAVISLYVAVGHWNSYFSALLYIMDRDLFPLQFILRQILILNQQMANIITNDMDAELITMLMRRQYMAEGMKYSLIFISSIPMLAAYPFVQKHFVKGVLIGSLKG